MDNGQGLSINFYVLPGTWESKPPFAICSFKLIVNSNFSPQVKISEEHTSSTDPEDSSGEINQADINDVQNYENIFKPRRQELNRTPEPKDEYEFELFQPPLSGSESDNNLSR